MFNLGAPEIMTIFLLALIVLGPQRLPDAAKQVGRFMGEMRKLSSGFQHELKTAFDDESEAAARARGAAVKPAGVSSAGVNGAGTAATEPTPEAPTTVAPARPPRAQPLRAPAKAATTKTKPKPKPKSKAPTTKAAKPTP